MGALRVMCLLDNTAIFTPQLVVVKKSNDYLIDSKANPRGEAG
jgi:hypothetical protein